METSDESVGSTDRPEGGIATGSVEDSSHSLASVMTDIAPRSSLPLSSSKVAVAAAASERGCGCSARRAVSSCMAAAAAWWTRRAPIAPAPWLALIAATTTRKNNNQAKIQPASFRMTVKRESRPWMDGGDMLMVMIRWGPSELAR